MALARRFTPPTDRVFLPSRLHAGVTHHEARRAMRVGANRARPLNLLDELTTFIWLWWVLWEEKSILSYNQTC